MERAGFTTKDNWQRMPKNMLRARCMAYAVRALFPEVLLGVYTDSEIIDAPIKGFEDEKYDTKTDEEGKIIIIPAASEGDTTVEDIEAEEVQEEEK